MTEQVKIEKFVHGGQGLGTLPSGKKVFVWNALPGEVVEVEIRKSKRGHTEAIATKIIEPSPHRCIPDELESYLSTSPWQIVNFAHEDKLKQDILRETFQREGIELADFEVQSCGQMTGYRNKMEWCFWGDDEGISLAHFGRGSHRKIKTTSSILANDRLNDAAIALARVLNANKDIRAGQLKSVIVRTGEGGTGSANQAVAALFVKDENFPVLQKPTELQGLAVYYSNPKSPAAVPTKLLQEEGDRILTDIIGGRLLTYDVMSFFQVNLPIFEKAIACINKQLGDGPKVDLYSGVGSIGLAIEGTRLLIESDPTNCAFARENIGARNIQVVEAPSEQALEYLTSTDAIIVDPPRSGLHKDVVARLSELQPPTIAYLSCNPITQARDVQLLQQAGYTLDFFQGFNFFPRTPHIESLAILRLIKK